MANVERIGKPTGPSQAEPEDVSALRASVPCAKIITQRDIIRGIPKRFRESYGRDLDGYCWKPGWTKRGILTALETMDVETASAKEVDEIIGNNSWTGIDCDLCGEPQTLIVRAGEEPDYEVRWLDICVKCARGLGEMTSAAQAIEAQGVKTEGLDRNDESAVA